MAAHWHDIADDSGLDMKTVEAWLRTTDLKRRNAADIRVILRLAEGELSRAEQKVSSIDTAESMHQRAADSKITVAFLEDVLEWIEEKEGSGLSMSARRGGPFR